MDVRTPSPHLARLEQTLGHERELLESLLYRLVAAKQILAANEARFVPRALQEVQDAMEDIREAEAMRSKAVDALAAEWGVPAGRLTLGWLASEGPESARPRLQDLRYAFMDLTKEVEQLTQENQRLASANLESIRGTLNMLHRVTEDPGIYDASGRRSEIAKAPMRWDRAL